MNEVGLSSLARPSGVKAGKEVGLPVFSVTKHAGFVSSLEYFKKQVFSRDLSGYKRVKEGELAYSTIHLDEGAIGIAPQECLISPMYSVFSVDATVVDPAYLLRYLKSPTALAEYQRLGKGSVHRRRSISLAALGQLKVPLPILDEQRRIAAILDRADALRAKRREALAHLDDLTQSIFLDLATSLTHVSTVNLGDVASFFGGASLPEGQAFEGQVGGHFLMKVSDMNHRGNERRITACALWSELPGGRSSTAPPDSVVIPKRGGAIGTNKKRLTTRNTVLDPNLMAIEPHFPLDITYLLHWFLNFDLSTITSGSSVPQLNKQDLTPLRIPLPTVAAQAKFANQIGDVQKLADKSRQLLALDERLFGALQSRAFSGQL